MLQTSERDSELPNEPNDPIGHLEFRSSARAGAAEAIRRLGLPVTVLSGDHLAEVLRIAKPLGLADVLGGLSPEDKAAWVTAREAAGDRVLFVGDGVNDAPALAAATVSIAMGDGAATAARVADIVVLEPSLRPIVALRVASRVARRTVRQNATFSLVYNSVSVAFAAAGVIGPLGAALLMPLSSLIVISNAVAAERRIQAQLEKAGPAVPSSTQAWRLGWTSS